VECDITDETIAMWHERTEEYKRDPSIAVSLSELEAELEMEENAVYAGGH
jgi:hypothetical protein